MSSLFKKHSCRLSFLECIIFWTYMLHVITKPSGILALKVSITQNITGFVGKKDTRLTCSFILEKDQSLISVSITAKNETVKNANDTPIAVFKPQKAARLTTPGDYLLGRVTLTNITYLFIDAAIQFDKLECIDEKDYMCIYNFFDKNDAVRKEKSEPTRILITASSAKPDSILSAKVSSPKAEYQRTTSYNLFNDLYNSSWSTKQNNLLTQRPFPVDTITTRQLQPDANTLLTLLEGDTVMFTCTGNIGKPPGKFIWQKASPLQKETVTYHTETTVKEEMPQICSLKGTSNLTLQISAEDLNATIRCFEESQADVPGMFIETGSFDVKFPVKLVNISKQPNKKKHERKTGSITLTCKGSGNPEPTYIWFKKDNNRNILARTNLYVIEDLIRNHSGVYICETYNTIDNVTYKKYNSVDIDIVHAAYVIPLVCAVFGIVICLAVRRRRNTKPNRGFRNDEESRCQNLDDRLMRCICIRSKYSTAVARNNTDASDGSEDSLAVSNGIQENSLKSENTAPHQFAVHATVTEQTIMKHEMCKPQTSDNVDHNGCVSKENCFD